MTKIEWTEATWNPVVGCSPVSEGCRNCYAAKEAVRLAGNPNEKISSMYSGTAEMRGLGKRRRAVFTGRVNLVPDRLEQPLRWRKPRKAFVNSMSDLFHRDVPFRFIDQVFATMALTPWHTYQILTKRPERMQEWASAPGRAAQVWSLALQRMRVPGGIKAWKGGPLDDLEWPLPNVWLGTSVEDQEAADVRIPHLVEAPAAVRFLSCEPLIGPVDLTAVYADAMDEAYDVDALNFGLLQWVIVGGESGPGARPCDIEWVRSVVRQCQSANVPVFVKQLGAKPVEGGTKHPISDRKGGDPAEWPEDLRVREYPAGAMAS